MSEHQGSTESSADKRETGQAQGSAESIEDKRQLAPETFEHVSPTSLARRHEVQGVSVRPLLVFTGVLTVILVAIGLVLWGVLGAAPPRVQLAPAEVTPVVSEGPGIQSAPGRERMEAIQPALARISTYGWVDREAGRIHIPIEEAMQRLVEQGVPAVEGDPPRFTAGPAYELDSEGGRLPDDE